MTNASAASADSPLALIARILIAVLFLVAGIRKLLAFAGTAGYFTKLGLPMGEAMTVLAIVIEVGGAILLIIGYQTKIVAWVLAAFVVIATLLAHQFWTVDAAQFGNQLNHFLKNVAIIGGLLLVISHGPGRPALDTR